MAKFHNKKETEKIGKCIRELRILNEFEIEDVVSMTGFTRKTLISIEKGSNTDISHVIEIAKAIGVHPMEIFNTPFIIKSRYKLSPKRLIKSKLTLRINKLYSETDFFKTPKYVSDVLTYLTEEYKIKTNSTLISVILKRLVTEDKLQYSKHGRRNVYKKQKIKSAL
ncbi:MAG: hypothetical protein JWO92_1223 [Chitinophagaceae bacterium]|nr:hypothetical protein [Chitinophagaceae bacterium]